MNEELKPCPFCGGEAVLGSSDMGHWAGCVNSECFVQTRAFYTKEEAIQTWNMRAADENPPLTLDEFRQMEGEPVWVVDMIPKYNNGWYALVSQLDTTFFAQAINSTKWGKDYGKTWFAYRRKPEEQ